MIVGRVDELKSGKLFGWAFNSEAPDEHLVIRVSRSTQIVASGVANIFRPDLPDAGIGNGDHAFEIIMPPNIESLHGVMVVAQSQKSGELALQIATNDDRRLDELVAHFSRRYEDALVALKEELDRLKERCSDLEAQNRMPATLALGDDVVERLNALEARMDAAEVFFLRIDETVSKLAAAQMKPKRKLFFGRF